MVRAAGRSDQRGCAADLPRGARDLAAGRAAGWLGLAMDSGMGGSGIGGRKQYDSRARQGSVPLVRGDGSAKNTTAFLTQAN